LRKVKDFMEIPHTRRRMAALAGELLILSALLGGCASSRVLKNPLPSEADVGWTTAGPEGLTIEVHQLIFRNTGGSWVRDANWDEYVLTIKNESGNAIEILAIDLYSSKFPTPVESSTSREQLDARSNRTLRTLKDVGIVAGVGIVGPSALIVAGIGTSGGIMSASAAGGAAAAIGIVAIPVGLIGGTAYVVSRHRQDTKDRALIDRRLAERGHRLPLQLPAQAQSTKSVFFPFTPAPTRLELSYSAGGDVREISLELPDLAGLHLRAPHPKVPQPASGSIAAPVSTF
jgi:hypothetical protein